MQQVVFKESCPAIQENVFMHLVVARFQPTRFEPLIPTQVVLK
jgi:hypothetical protein